MNTRPDDAAIDVALRALDPAPRTGLTIDERDRADVLFDRLVASPASSPVPTSRERHPRRRAVTVGGTAAAVVAAITAPMLLGGGSAFASWTPTPEPVGLAELPLVESACRERMGVFDEELKVALAEQRGEWIYVKLVADEKGLTCLMPENYVDSPDEQSGGMGGFSPDGDVVPSLAADGFDESSWAIGFYDDEAVTYIDGYVGSDVTGVNVHVSTGLDIEASVANGRYAAWWPSEPQSSKVPAETYTYTVTLADGTTREIDPSTLDGE